MKTFTSLPSQLLLIIGCLICLNFGYSFWRGYTTHAAEIQRELAIAHSDMGTPSADPGVYQLYPKPKLVKTFSTPGPNDEGLVLSPEIFTTGLPIFGEKNGMYEPIQIDSAGRLKGQCYPTNKKLKAGLPYSRMYFKIDDINFLCERQ